MTACHILSFNFFLLLMSYEPMRNKTDKIPCGIGASATEFILKKRGK